MDIVEQIARLIDPPNFACTPETYGTDAEGFKKTWAYGGQLVARKKAQEIAELFSSDTITSLRARCASLEAERDGLKAERDGLALALAEIDFCYDPDEWEFTCSWDERDQVHGYGEALTPGNAMEVATLICGPRKWVAAVPTSWDEDGEPLDTEIQWFDTEEDALAALRSKGEA